MTITPKELLDTSIAQLQMLSAFLGDHLGGRSESSGTEEIRACEEIFASVGALILKLQTPRRARSAQS